MAAIPKRAVAFDWNINGIAHLDLAPNERLVTDSPDWRGDPAKPKTRVAWLLDPIGEKTASPSCTAAFRGSWTSAITRSDGCRSCTR